LFENWQNASTADLFPPLCVKFSCRATARLRKFALIGEEISRRWAFANFQTSPKRAAGTRSKNYRQKGGIFPPFRVKLCSRYPV